MSVKDDRKGLSDATRLSDVSTELTVKDLGPQISWRTVFMVEYVRFFTTLPVIFVSLLLSQVGPLIIHPLIYHFPKVFYGGPVQHSRLQQCVCFILRMILCN
jgi:very-long-chain enoyl-CoA reductase